MKLRNAVLAGIVCSTAIHAGRHVAHAQPGAEIFTATATVTTVGNAKATAPVSITVERKLAPAEVESLVNAFKSGGGAALRKALADVPPTGSVSLTGTPIPVRIAIERPTDKGRLLTFVTDQPVLFLGAGLPGARPKDGYEFAVIDIELDAAGSGSGTISPAAKIAVKDGAFVVEDYSSELVRLTSVRTVK
jgi:hypothetical protein